MILLAKLGRLEAKYVSWGICWGWLHVVASTSHAALNFTEWGKSPVRSVASAKSHSQRECTQKTEKAKSNGMSWIVNELILKLRNDMRKKFVEQCDNH